MFWALTAAGKRIPVDWEPHPDGNLYIVGYDSTTPKVEARTGESLLDGTSGPFKSHFATCPNAAEHRRR
jgi:hypothetical protein